MARQLNYQNESQLFTSARAQDPSFEAVNMSGKRLVKDYVSLAKLEVKEWVLLYSQSAGFAVVGGIALLASWILFVAGAINFAIERGAPQSGPVFFWSAFHLAVGVFAFLRIRKWMKTKTELAQKSSAQGLV